MARLAGRKKASATRNRALNEAKAKAEAEENAKFKRRGAYPRNYESKMYQGVYAPNFIEEMAGQLRLAHGARNLTPSRRPT